MKNELLSRGIYAIINKELNMVYVGQTQTNFLIRWIEHLIVIPTYEDLPKRIHLYLNRATKFIILKNMDIQEEISINLKKRLKISILKKNGMFYQRLSLILIIKTILSKKWLLKNFANDIEELSNI